MELTSKFYDGFDWDLLETCARQVLGLARQLRLWVVLGSTHRLMGRHKPYDSVYVINDSGMFTLKGIRCGVLICYEYAFPELYRAWHPGHGVWNCSERRMRMDVGRCRMD